MDINNIQRYDTVLIPLTSREKAIIVS